MSIVYLQWSRQQFTENLSSFLSPIPYSGGKSKSWWSLGLPNGSGIGFPKQEEVLVIIPYDNFIVTSLTAVSKKKKILQILLKWA